MTVEAHITPAVLRWARVEKRGYALHEVELVTTIPAANVEAFEQGERLPTMDEARTLADCYGISVALLFMPKPPTHEEVTCHHCGGSGVLDMPIGIKVRR